MPGGPTSCSGSGTAGTAAGAAAGGDRRSAPGGSGRAWAAQHILGLSESAAVSVAAAANITSTNGSGSK